MNKLKLPEITPRRFYLIGKYSFFIGGVIGLIRIVDLWSELKSYDIFSSLASTIFTFTLFGFFAHLGKKEEKMEDADDDDIIKMNKALEDLNLEEEKQNAEKR